ncbi:hypothetical protein P9112_007896 [Eukaryota sp. TZLM1-RC]
MSFVPESVTQFESKLHAELQSMVYRNPKDVLITFAVLTDPQREQFIAKEIRCLEDPACFLEAAEILKIILVADVSSSHHRSLAHIMLNDLRNSDYEQVRRVVVDIMGSVDL